MIKPEGIKPQKQLFHNVKIDVYPTKASLEDITYWRDNLRTVLSFSLLKKECKKEKQNSPSEKSAKGNIKYRRKEGRRVPAG